MKQTRIFGEKISNKELVGRGGLALVEYHLARRGIESVRTQGNSPSGDLWADTPNGKVSIEVKTSSEGKAWIIRKSQKKSDIWCLVYLAMGSVWVLSDQEMNNLTKHAADAYSGHLIIPFDMLPTSSAEAWNKVGAKLMLPIPNPRKSYVNKAPRTVKRTLRDGTEKVYTYAPFNRQTANHTIILQRLVESNNNEQNQ